MNSEKIGNQIDQHIGENRDRNPVSPMNSPQPRTSSPGPDTQKREDRKNFKIKLEEANRGDDDNSQISSVFQSNLQSNEVRQSQKLPKAPGLQRSRTKFEYQGALVGGFQATRSKPQTRQG
jgi:hypothetical protein